MVSPPQVDLLGQSPQPHSFQQGQVPGRTGAYRHLQVNHGLVDLLGQVGVAVHEARPCFSLASNTLIRSGLGVRMKTRNCSTGMVFRM